jgi:hypothetical protein
MKVRFLRKRKEGLLFMKEADRESQPQISVVSKRKCLLFKGEFRCSA